MHLIYPFVTNEQEQQYFEKEHMIRILNRLYTVTRKSSNQKWI